MYASKFFITGTILSQAPEEITSAFSNFPLIVSDFLGLVVLFSIITSLIKLSNISLNLLAQGNKTLAFIGLEYSTSTPSKASGLMYKIYSITASKSIK